MGMKMEMSVRNDSIRVYCQHKFIMKWAMSNEGILSECRCISSEVSDHAFYAHVSVSIRRPVHVECADAGAHTWYVPKRGHQITVLVYDNEKPVRLLVS